MRDILFRGFHEDPNGEEIIFFDGKEIKGKWVYGYYCPTPFSRFPCKPSIYPIDTINSHWHGIEVIPETVGQYTGLVDNNDIMIFEDDVVKFLGHKGKITFDCGAFGVYVPERIDHDYLASEIETITGCNNSPCFCYNDYFISLWELIWNYNDEFECCNVLDVVGNIYSNPELLG